MPGNSSTINSILYAAGPKTAGRLGRAIQTQATGKKDQSKNQVNKAIEMRTNFYISKTEGALQNIKTAQGFLSTVAQNLETTLDKLTDMTQSIMTLLNGVIPAGDKEAAVAGLLEGLGMVDNATSRSQQEGVIIKSLRQGGSGQSLYFRSKSSVLPASFSIGAAKAGGDTSELQSIVDFDKNVLVALGKGLGDCIKAAGETVSVDSTNTAKDMTDAMKTMLAAEVEKFSTEDTGLVTKLDADIDASTDASGLSGIAETALSSASFDSNFTTTGIAGAIQVRLEVVAAAYSGDWAGGKIALKAETAKITTMIGAVPTTVTDGGTGTAQGDFDSAKTTVLEELKAPFDTYMASGQGKEHADALAASGGGSSSRPTTALTTAKNFIINPNSNYGSGDFYLTYEAGNIKVFDEFDSLIESYPLPSAEFEKAFPTGATDPVLIKVGTIGFIEFEPAIWDSATKTVDWTDQGIFFNIKTADLSATITVSGNDGTRTINMPDLTNPVNLWGVEAGTLLDTQLLQDNVAYQQEVKGFIDHASQVVRSQLQTISNVMATLQTDEEAQNVSLQSSHDQVDTVSMADPVVSAQQVLTISQEQSRLVNALYIMSGLDRKNNEQAQQIAQMASA